MTWQQLWQQLQALAPGILCFGAVDPAVVYPCLVLFLASNPAASQAVISLANQIIQLIGGGSNMPACTTTHRTSTKVQGAGVCCALVGTTLIPVPGQATYPVYSAATAPTLPHAPAANSLGQCGTCYIAGSKSPKHPGKPILKFIRGGVSCPTTGTGCCSLAAAA